MASTLIDLLTLLGLALVTAALGYGVLLRAKLLSGRFDLGLAFAGCLGLGILSYITLLFAALHLLHLSAWLLIAAVLLVTALLLRNSHRPWVPNWPEVDWRERLSTWGLLNWGLLGIVLAHLFLNLLAALAPPTGVDPLIYHLAVPGMYLREGGMKPWLSVYPSNWPLTVEMIFLFGMWLRTPILAQLLHWWMGVLVIVSILGIGRLVSGFHEGLLAAVIFLSISDVTHQFSLAMVDLSATLFLLLAFVAIIYWQRNSEVTWLLLAGVLAGFYAGSKLSNAGLVIALGLTLAFFSARQRQAASIVLSSFAKFGTVAFLVASPWYLRSWLYTGNPVYPYLYEVFGGRGLSAEAAAYQFQVDYLKTVGARTVSNFLGLPLLLTFQPHQLRSGHIGPLFLSLLPVLLVSLRRTKLPSVLIVGLGFAGVSLPIWFWTYPRVRTLLPAIAVLAVCVAWVSYWTMSHHRKVAMLRWVVIGMLGLWFTMGLMINVRAHASAVTAALGVQDKDVYAEKTLRATGFQWYRDYQQINSILPPQSRVLIWEQRGFYLKRPYEWAGGLYRGLATPSELSDADALLQKLWDMGITHVALHSTQKASSRQLTFQRLLDDAEAMQVIYQSSTMTLAEILYPATVGVQNTK